MEYATDDDPPRHPSSSGGGGLPPAAAPLFVEKELMFDKVVTPSDVGKLNRLVIPKQHAEKYFPLDNASGGDKGLLLSFEDRTGNSWRFRYSYWNSSQSYVMTKGWSRFVKEKRLNPGDTVSFGRGVGEAARDRFFIDWKRRRPDYALTNLPPRLPQLAVPISSYHHQHHHLGISSNMVPFACSGIPLGRVVWPPSPPPTMAAFDCGYSTAAVSNPHLYLQRPRGSPLQVAVQVGVGKSGRDGGDGEPGVPMVLDSVPVVKSSAAAAKRVRLFGVNLDFPAAEAVSEGEPLLKPSIGAANTVEPPRKDKDKSPVSVDLF